ncbi:MAG: oligosaccharide flippase family protein [Coriobacteriia bacterium]|nr:oligosaccharide flippase family protein [Coriobacteriia bacterium]
MTQDNLKQKTANAARWSMVTQVLSKIIAPITTMVLARILAPEAFGIVAVATMVFSLADMISDTGLKRYLVYKRFEDDEEESLCASTAFWINITLSVILMSMIILFSNQIVSLAGMPGYGSVLVLAVVSLPLTAFITVQTGLLEKKLDFKTLFGGQVGAKALLFLGSVPLALAGYSYWSLIIATLASNVFLAVWLTVKSSWKPEPRFSLKQLRRMFKYSIWVIIDSLLNWTTIWAGVFIIAINLDPTSVGYYRTTTHMSLGIIGIIISATGPVLHSSLSKVQDDEERFSRIFYSLQNYLALIVVPIAFGALVYRDLITLFFLGQQWQDTATFFGLSIFASSIHVLFSFLVINACFAKGKPRQPVIIRGIYLVPMVASLHYCSLQGYEFLSVFFPATQLLLPAIALFFAKHLLNVSVYKMVSNSKWFYLIALAASTQGVIVTTLSDSAVLAAISIIVFLATYVLLVCLIKPARITLVEFFDKMGWMKGVVLQLRR